MAIVEEHKLIFTEVGANSNKYPTCCLGAAPKEYGKL